MQLNKDNYKQLLVPGVRICSTGDTYYEIILPLTFLEYGGDIDVSNARTSCLKNNSDSFTDRTPCTAWTPGIKSGSKWATIISSPENSDNYELTF